MGAAQITMMCLLALSVGIHVAKHGEPRRDKYSVWTGLLAAAINIAILWWGGFWS